MKSKQILKYVSPSVSLLAVLTFFAPGQHAAAVTYYWDTSATTGIQTGSSTWDTGVTSNWNTASAGTGTWGTWADDSIANITGPSTLTIGTGATIKTTGIVTAGSTTINGGTIQLDATGSVITQNAGSGILTINSAVVVNSSVAGTVTLANYNVTSAGSLTINGNISQTGGGSIGLRYGGYLVLTGSNSFTGGIRVNASTSTSPSLLSVTQAAALASGTIELDAPSVSTYASTTLDLKFATTGTAANAFYFIPNANGSVTIQSSGAGAAVLSNASAITVNSGAALTLNFSGTSTAANTFAGKIVNGNSTNYTILNKLGTGTWILSGSSTYTGGSTIKNGTLGIGASNISTTSGALGASTSSVTLGDSTGSNSASLVTTGAYTFSNAITVASGNTGTQTIGAAQTSGTSNFTGNITLNKAVTLAAADGGTVDFNTGTWTPNNNAVNVTGTGTSLVKISNTLSTTGGVNVNGGTLAVNGSIVGSTTTVNSGATLTGAGTTAGVTVASGGTLAGTLTTGALTVQNDRGFRASPLRRFLHAPDEHRWRQRCRRDELGPSGHHGQSRHLRVECS
jgi:autotransporter-associated beta strand protein